MGETGTRAPGIPSMRDILVIEDDARLASWVCPGTNMLLWPMVRTAYLRLILSDLLYDTPLPNTAGRVGGRKQQALGLLEGAWRNLRARRHQVPVLIRATSPRGNSRDGLVFNPLSDHFIATAPDRHLALEDLGGARVPRDRVNANVIYHDPVLVQAALRARISRGGAARQTTAEKLTTYVSTRAADLLGWHISDDDRAWFTALVARYSARAPHLLRGYTRMLKRHGTRLLIAEEACYGNTVTCLVWAAKALGLPVAEFQHGMVSQGHDAYMLAPTLAADARYAQALPDYFLGYGAWWNAQLGVPVTPVVIGNPRRAAALADMADMAQNTPADAGADKSTVLVLGDGVETGKYIAFARDLATALPDRRIMLRPHPLERAALAARYPDGQIGGGQIGSVALDQAADIHHSFAHADAVVSEMSTGLFDAIGLANRVFTWATPRAKFALPTHPFTQVTDAADLADQLAQHPQVGTVRDSTDIWASDWRENYRAFIAKVLDT